MADYYFDSSALVKRYVTEIGSSWIVELFDPSMSHDVFVVAITPVEMIAAIARRARANYTTETDATAAIGLIRSDLQTRYQVIELTEPLLSSAMRLAEIHALRGYDAVQLAGALEVNALLLSNDLPPMAAVQGRTGSTSAAVGIGRGVK